MLNNYEFPSLKSARALLGFFMLLFAVVVLRNAWVGDDAYITFRSVFNFTEGYGPSYNVDERVQNFTNPLWMFLVSFFYFFTGEAYFTSIIISLSLTLGVVWIMATRIREWEFGALFSIALLMLSKSFIDFSTSGLENPLNHLLLLLFCWKFLSGDWDDRKLLILSLIAGLGVLNRMDTLLLYLPALLFGLWKVHSLKAAGLIALGFLPFILWEFFALFYYGFPFPNTAYAKLNTGIPSEEMTAQGFFYLINSLNLDPMTLLVIFSALLLVVMRKSWDLLPLAIGVLLYLIYIIKIGGDFMSGRFISAPFLVSVVLLSKVIPTKLPGIIWGVILLGIGLQNQLCPVFTTTGDKPVTEKVIDRRGIADERLWYSNSSGLLNLSRETTVLKNERTLDENSDLKPELTVLFFDNIGFIGYEVGPSMHVIDRWALGDPLLARLPMVYVDDWRIGHFTRNMPLGYLQTLRSGKNELKDKDLAEYYDHLCAVTKGPLWSWDRFGEIWNLNTGAYTHLIDVEHYANSGKNVAKLEELQNYKAEGTDWNAPGNIIIPPFRTLMVDLGKSYRSTKVEFSADNNDTYEFTFYDQGSIVGVRTIYPRDSELGGLNVYTFEVDPSIYEVGFNKIEIRGLGGDEYYSIGHLKLMNR